MGSIRQIAQLLDSGGARVVEFLLPPETDAPWHVHSAMVEFCYCLSGRLIVEREGAESIVLSPGERCEVPAGQRHRAVNRSKTACRFLVVQQGDYFDFVQA
jgi:mannose-6-phosphate isomerase-like protein (cupin superfamily)